MPDTVNVKRKPHLLLVTIWVWNSDKFNSTNLQELFDLVCLFTLLEWLEVVGCPISVIFAVSDYQKNGLFMVIAGQQAGVRNTIVV